MLLASRFAAFFWRDRTKDASSSTILPSHPDALLCWRVEMTVLGKSPALPDAGGANSGYLIRHDGFTLLLECGSGVFAKLRAVCDPHEVDAVLISHLHADHTLDLYPFSHALTYHGRAEGERPRLWAPPGSERAFATLGAVFGAERQISEAFALAEYDPDRSVGGRPVHGEVQRGAALRPGLGVRPQLRGRPATSRSVPTAGPTTRSSVSRARRTC